MVIHWGHSGIKLICLYGIAEEEHHMNKTHTHLQAAASAGFCGRNAFVRSLVLAGAIACASVSAVAQQNPPPQQSQQGNREQPRQERMAPMPQQRHAEPQRAEPRQYDTRAFDSRIEEQRRQSQVQQQQEGSRRGGRLTPDERAELRRQINEAGMDLYQNAPRR
jgi:hypothetical protein